MDLQNVTKIYKSLQKWRVLSSQDGRILKIFVYPSGNTTQVGPCEFWWDSGLAPQNWSARYEPRFNSCFSASSKAKSDLIHRSLERCPASSPRVLHDCTYTHMGQNLRSATPDFDLITSFDFYVPTFTAPPRYP